MLGLRSKFARRAPRLLNGTAANAIRILIQFSLSAVLEQSTKRKLFAFSVFYSKTLISIVTLTLFLGFVKPVLVPSPKRFLVNESNKEHNKPHYRVWLAMFMPQRPDSGLRTPRAFSWSMSGARRALMKTNISWIHKRWQINSHLTLMYPVSLCTKKVFLCRCFFLALSRTRREKRACNRYYLLNRLTSRNIDIQMRKKSLNRSSSKSAFAK